MSRSYCAKLGPRVALCEPSDLRPSGQTAKARTRPEVPALPAGRVVAPDHVIRYHAFGMSLLAGIDEISTGVARPVVVMMARLPLRDNAVPGVGRHPVGTPFVHDPKLPFASRLAR